MLRWVRQQFETAYERHLRRRISGAPTHVAVIQDGNRRYARKQGDEATDGHRAGAKTTEQILYWCDELGIEELTLYTFSTENFDRPDHEREELFDLLVTKLREFADADLVLVDAVGVGELPELPHQQVEQFLALVVGAVEVLGREGVQR